MRTGIVQQDAYLFTRRVKVGLTIANKIYFDNIKEHKSLHKFMLCFAQDL